MARLNSVGYEVQNGVNAVRHSSALEKATRVGFACKGVVYILIGVLAILAAFGEGGETTDQRGVLDRVAAQPFGEFALVIIGVGLLAYAFWRFCSAVYDTESAGSDKKGMAKRAGYFGSGIAYAGVAIYALRLLTGDGGGSGSNSVTWTAKLMNAPAGTLLVAAVGIGIIIFGVMQVRKGLKEKFLKRLRMNEMSEAERTTATRAGKWGYSARGVVFGVIGLFFVQAAMRHDPNQAKGLEGALDAIASQSFGPWLLTAVALGLIGYGVYSLFEARYRAVRH